MRQPLLLAASQQREALGDRQPGTARRCRKSERPSPTITSSAVPAWRCAHLQLPRRKLQLLLRWGKAAAHRSRRHATRAWLALQGRDQSRCAEHRAQDQVQPVRTEPSDARTPWRAGTDRRTPEESGSIAIVRRKSRTSSGLARSKAPPLRGRVPRGRASSEPRLIDCARQPGSANRLEQLVGRLCRAQWSRRSRHRRLMRRGGADRGAAALPLTFRTSAGSRGGRLVEALSAALAVPGVTEPA